METPKEAFSDVRYAFSQAQQFSVIAPDPLWNIFNIFDKQWLTRIITI